MARKFYLEFVLRLFTSIASTYDFDISVSPLFTVFFRSFLLVFMAVGRFLIIPLSVIYWAVSPLLSSIRWAFPFSLKVVLDY